MPAGTLHPRPRLIESRQNPRVKELRAALARSGRTPGGLLAIEGEHLVEEALRSGLRFHTIFLRDGYTAPFTLPPAEHLLLPAGVFATVAATDQPQGIAALVDAPAFTAADIFQGHAPLVVVLAGLQDPGNVGTLLRSAEAFAATGALLLPGTASPWNPKTLRASAGSAFRVPTLQVSEAETIALLRNQRVTPIAAVARNGEPLDRAPLAGPCALLIGNEGAGLSPEFVTATGALPVTIPTPGAVESLNAAVAGSLLLYEASRQRTTQPSSFRSEPSRASATGAADGSAF